MRCKRKKKTQSRKLLEVFVTILPDYPNLQEAVFYNSTTQLSRHLICITLIDGQLVCNLPFDTFSPIKYRHKTHTFRG
jgi:hypothetical protein